MKITLLSGGAAHGLVDALSRQFKAETGCDIEGSFGAVGGMRDRLAAGAPADLVILTAAVVAELTESGHVVEGSARDIGAVRTGIAVRAGDPALAIGDAADLCVALGTAEEIFFPDPTRATAGIHFAGVLDRLGVGAGPRRIFPNGAAAMRSLSQSTARRAIGCTQITEILNTPGVTLVGPLPDAFALSTTYTIGVCTRAALPDQAEKLAALLTGEAARAAREKAGFGR